MADKDWVRSQRDTRGDDEPENGSTGTQPWTTTDSRPGPSRSMDEKPRPLLGPAPPPPKIKLEMSGWPPGSGYSHSHDFQHCDPRQQRSRSYGLLPAQSRNMTVAQEKLREYQRNLTLPLISRRTEPVDLGYLPGTNKRRSSAINFMDPESILGPRTVIPPSEVMKARKLRKLQSKSEDDKESAPKKKNPWDFFNWEDDDDEDDATPAPAKQKNTPAQITRPGTSAEITKANIPPSEVMKARKLRKLQSNGEDDKESASAPKKRNPMDFWAIGDWEDDEDDATPAPAKQKNTPAQSTRPGTSAEITKANAGEIKGSPNAEAKPKVVADPDAGRGQFQNVSPRMFSPDFRTNRHPRWSLNEVETQRTSIQTGPPVKIKLEKPESTSGIYNVKLEPIGQTAGTQNTFEAPPYAVPSGSFSCRLSPSLLASDSSDESRDSEWPLPSSNHGIKIEKPCPVTPSKIKLEKPDTNKVTAAAAGGNESPLPFTIVNVKSEPRNQPTQTFTPKLPARRALDFTVSPYSYEFPPETVVGFSNSALPNTCLVSGDINAMPRRKNLYEVNYSLTNAGDQEIESDEKVGQPVSIKQEQEENTNTNSAGEDHEEPWAQVPVIVSTATVGRGRHGIFLKDEPVSEDSDSEMENENDGGAEGSWQCKFEHNDSNPFSPVSEAVPAEPEPELCTIKQVLQNHVDVYLEHLAERVELSGIPLDFVRNRLSMSLEDICRETHPSASNPSSLEGLDDAQLEALYPVCTVRSGSSSIRMDTADAQ